MLDNYSYNVWKQHAGLLTPICEALCTLLYPFTWEHVYIPFLPVKLIEYLHVREVVLISTILLFSPVVRCLSARRRCRT